MTTINQQDPFEDYSSNKFYNFLWFMEDKIKLPDRNGLYSHWSGHALIKVGTETGTLTQHIFRLFGGD